ncbi:MAG: ribonuclease III [Zetaproteobacteria bacterium]|nr:ribonuclease III [Zetaproteobacteria bacterium]
MHDLKKFNRFQQDIGYTFNEIGLLKTALTHASAVTHMHHMERLEFLGDSVLGVIISNALFERFPKVKEGELTRMRASLVCKDSLLIVAKQWHIKDALKVGDGERDKAGRIRSVSILANAVEAVIAAVFRDAGFELATVLVLRSWDEMLQAVNADQVKDPKSSLQEWTQARAWGVPEYIVQDLGIGKEPRFHAQCMVNGKLCAEGYGMRKKLAELQAAERAYAWLQQD